MRKKIVKFILVGFIWFMIIEIGARIFFGSPQKSVDILIPDPILNHKWQPNSTYTDTGRDIPFTLYINSESWVETRDIPKEKPQNTIRIFYVGDSTTQAVVDPPEKMTTLVQKSLEKKLQGKHVEVINTGTSSYAPSLYYLFIKNQILNYSPDIIVVNIDMTDVRDDAIYKTLTTYDKYGLPQTVHPSSEDLRSKYVLAPSGLMKVPKTSTWQEQIHSFIYEHVASYYHFENFMFSLKRSNTFRNVIGHAPLVLEIPKPGYWLTKNWDKETSDDVLYTESLLDAIVQLARQHHVVIALTSVPHYPQYTGYWSAKPHEVLQQFAQKENVPFLNGYTALRNKIKDSKQTDYYWAVDPTHFNKEGNKIWADAQVRFLLDPNNHMLSGSSASQSAK